MRFSATKNMHIVSGDILYASKAKQQSGIAWKTQIDNPILNGPYTVFNHISGKENIFYKTLLCKCILFLRMEVLNGNAN